MIFVHIITYQCRLAHMGTHTSHAMRARAYVFVSVRLHAVRRSFFVSRIFAAAATSCACAGACFFCHALLLTNRFDGGVVCVFI